MESRNRARQRNRWTFVIAGVVVFLLAGVIYAWSVLSQPIAAEHTGWTATMLSVTFTLAMVFFCLGTLLIGIIAGRLTPRFTLILSAIFFLAGFFLASLTKNSPWQLYIGFGVLCGLGSGFAYNAVLSTVSAWFPDRQGMASGILLMGYGFSSFIIGKIYTAATTARWGMSWKTAFIAMGVIIFVVLLVASFFFVRPEADFQPPEPARKRKAREPAMEATTGQMLRTRSFWMFYIWITMAGGAGMILLSQASGIALEVRPGTASATVATVVGMISVLNACGRVVYGSLFDLKGFRLTLGVAILSNTAAALTLILSIATGNFALLAIGFMLGGFAYGGPGPSVSAFSYDFFGRKHYSTNFSVAITNGIIASFASTIAGRLYDVSQSYMSSMVVMLGITAVGFVAYLLIRRPKPQA